MKKKKDWFSLLSSTSFFHEIPHGCSVRTAWLLHIKDDKWKKYVSEEIQKASIRVSFITYTFSIKMNFL